MCNTVCIRDLTVASETVEEQCQSLVALDVARTLEIFIQHGTDQILRRGNKARRWNFVRKLAADQPVVVCKVDIHLHIKRCARG